MSNHRITEAFTELADMLVERFDSIEFLHVLAEHSVELLPVDAAGILLADEQGVLRLMAAHTLSTPQVELFLPQGEEGPSEECFRSGRTVRCRNFGAMPPRWPRFTAAAVQLGFAAADAVPMRLWDEVIGSLTLLRTSPGTLSTDDAVLAQSFANVATISLFQMRVTEQDRAPAGQLQAALANRVAIEQAKGVLTERLGIGVADAVSLLRDHARDTGRPLSEIARQVNERSPEVAGLTRAGKQRPRR
ncbi:ANTAR domain-containing protein [Lentzea sp. HUAS TT2]|uniref:ANTAR domain-containing protein n=1 Tax=Lentzea sp. HUAS TT2 TaxID=3447454 RepID=UPI003F730A50